MGSIGTGASAGAGSATNNSSVIPTTSTSDIQKYVDTLNTDLKLNVVVHRVYDNLPVVEGGFTTFAGFGTNHGASIVNGKYLQIDNGPLLQFRRTKNGWKVKEI